MSDHRWCPDKCPITGRPFFCWIEDEDGSQVPTYGGPFDSYTLPEQDEDGEFTVKHYDHDLGGWRDYMNLGLRLIDDQREDHEWGTVEALQARIAEQDAAIALMRGQSDMVLVPRTLTAENGAKGALIGEFTTPFVMQCLECTDGFVDDEVCDDCDGAGSFTVRVPVEWTTIKDIHKAMIAHFHPAPKDTADEQ